MNGLGRIALLGFLVVPACSDGPGQTGPDAAIDVGDDGGVIENTGGLELVFETDPEELFEDAIDGDFDPVLEEVEIRLGDLRLIGDAAPGDERTTEGRVDLTWEREEEVRFSEAPAGSYSLLKADITRFELRGTLEIEAGSPVPFRIRETEITDMEIALDMRGFRVETDALASLEILVKMKEIINDPDWVDVVPNPEGMLDIDPDSNIGRSVRGKVGESFSIPSQPGLP